MLNDPRTAVTALRFAQGLVGDVAQMAQAAAQAAKSGTEQARAVLGESFADVLSAPGETSEVPAAVNGEELADRLRQFLQSAGVPANGSTFNLTLGRGERFRVDAGGVPTSGIEASVEQWINDEQFGDLGQELRRWLQANPERPFTLQLGEPGRQS